MEANVFDNINGHLLKELNEIKKTVIYIYSKYTIFCRFY